MPDRPHPGARPASHSRSGSVALTTATVEVIEHGPADGPVAVFAHGALVSGTVWGEVPARLADDGIRSVVPTLPLGAHRTPVNDPDGYSLDAAARCIAELIEELGCGPVVLVGNDTGGALCQLIATTRPDLLHALVLTNCDAFEVFPPFPFDLFFRLCRHPRLARLALAATRLPRVRRSPLAFGLLSRSRIPDEVSAGWVTPYLTDARVRRDLASLARSWRPDSLEPVTPLLADRQVAVHVVWGGADRFFRPALGRRIAEVSGGTYREVPGARTYLALDAPGAVAATIRAAIG